jgi:hypothetical protein
MVLSGSCHTFLLRSSTAQAVIKLLPKARVSLHHVDDEAFACFHKKVLGKVKCLRNSTRDLRTGSLVVALAKDPAQEAVTQLRFSRHRSQA